MSLKTHSVTKTKRTMLESGSFFVFKLNTSPELPINDMWNNTKRVKELKKVLSLVTITLLAVQRCFPFTHRKQKQLKQHRFTVFRFFPSHQTATNLLGNPLQTANQMQQMF
ncbi:hypothetical protein C7M22_03481 [Bacillus velezensis]|nr:hypothetical protein C7M21_02518 [Bacillus velezensis]QHK65523.1 hypothetical protein C7M22_03481 [Bacillus velezensis]QHL94192.1 hypothetical protein C7M24_02179 [Bacillus velezensis]QHL98743.1 hypothetical protein C7M25_02969 [Bacillus velezensis]